MYKKQLLFFFIGLITLFIFNACADDQEKEDPDGLLTMDCGYQYIHHLQNEGPKPQVGEVAYYYFNFKADDSLMMDGREAEMVSKMQIPEPLPNPREAVSPLMEGIKLMSIGDSITDIIPLDSVPPLPPDYGEFTN